MVKYFVCYMFVNNHDSLCYRHKIIDCENIIVDTAGLDTVARQLAELHSAVEVVLLTFTKVV